MRLSFVALLAAVSASFAAEIDDLVEDTNADFTAGSEAHSLNETTVTKDDSSGEPDVGQKVVLLVEQGGKSLGNLTLGLYNEVAPKTAKNFYVLAKSGKYTKTLFHRVIKDFMIQGGDLDGKGGYSIYGKERGDLPDENFVLKHDRPGRLAMANAGPNSALSQFYITTKITEWLDGQYVVFGQLLDGFDTLTAVENTATSMSDKPLDDVIVKKVWTYDAAGDLDTELTKEEKGYGLGSKKVEEPEEGPEGTKNEKESGKKSEKESEKTDESEEGFADLENDYGSTEQEGGEDGTSSDGSESESGNTKVPLSGSNSFQEEYEKEATGAKPQYLQVWSVVPLILFAALIVVILLKTRKNILFAIRGPRYRRLGSGN